MLTTGTKYESGRNVTDIARMIRADLKAAVKAGELAPCKFSVVTDRYSMGQSITVTVKGVPAGFGIVNPLRAMLDHENPHFAYHTLAQDDPRYPQLTPEAAAVVATVTEIVNAYNRRDVDSSTDYYNVCFSEHVGFDCGLKEADRKRVIAAAEAAPEAPNHRARVIELRPADRAALEAARPAPAPAPAPAYTPEELGRLARELAEAQGLELAGWTIQLTPSGAQLVATAEKTTANGCQIKATLTMGL